MKIVKWTLMLILVLAVAVGCRQQAQTSAEDVKIELSVNPETPAVGEATLLVAVTDGDGEPISDAKVSARGDMNHAGMVPVIEEVEGGTDGVYEIPFEWTMAGDWIVEVTVTLASGETATETFDLSVEGETTTMDDMNMTGEMTEDASVDEMTEEADMGDMDMDATPTMEIAE